MLKFFMDITYVWNMWLEHQKYPNVAANIKTFRLLLHPKAFIISENSKTLDYCKLKMCINMLF